MQRLSSWQRTTRQAGADPLLLVAAAATAVLFSMMLMCPSRLASRHSSDSGNTRLSAFLMPFVLQPGTSTGMGSVAEYLSKNCKRPMAVVRPHMHGQ
jgi:hypothetical protein